ncbi:MAG: hypothetical protein KIT48_11635 [Pseudolabrys sp.]|nr:hypothetical protein [Pseudolabrys sp.]
MNLSDLKPWRTGAVMALLTLLSCRAGAAAEAAGDMVIPPATYPALMSHAPTPEAFVPEGWRMESQVSGDLNADRQADIVLVLRQNAPGNIVDARGRGGPERFDTNPRILAVAVAAAGGGYDLVAENHTLIGRTTEPSQQDPLDPDGVQAGGIEIVRGTLRVTLGYFGGAMGHRTLTFRLRNQQLLLIGYDSIHVERSRGSLDQVSINYLTRRMKRTTGTISSDAETVTHSAVQSRRLLAIDEVGDGLAFERAR